MTMYYKNGFYSVPQDGAIELTNEEYETLIIGQSNGKLIVEDGRGRPMLADPPPSDYHEWNGVEWEITPENAVKHFADAKVRKLNEINKKAQDFVRDMAKLDETPEFEQATWQEQANEARAWFADKSTPTPKLDLLAMLRGVPPEILRQKCYEKAQAFYQLSFAVAGQRQKYEDTLKSAEDLTAVLAIAPVYTLEINNEQD